MSTTTQHTHVTPSPPAGRVCVTAQGRSSPQPTGLLSIPLVGHVTYNLALAPAPYPRQRHSAWAEPRTGFAGSCFSSKGA